MNIAEIAKLAGVSKAAVSRYFNHGYISEEKREAIRKVVEETGYRPSIQAQTLRTKKTKMIGVIVPKIASASIGRVVEGILSVVNESGYQMLLAVTQNSPKKEMEYLSAFDDKQVDGVILAATVFSAEYKRILKKLSVPVVIVGQQLSGYCCVFHDDYHASYDLTKLFLDQGRSKLGYIGAIQQDKAVGAERYRGFKDAVCDSGYDELEENYVIASFTMASGYEKAGELFEKCRDLDGLICATDTIAAGAVQYLREHGVKIPEEILVAGQGDSELARVTAPPLITVHYSYEKSGELAVQMLMDVLEKKEAACKEVKLGYSIVT
ncbi:LacI family transcriptional regulator [Petralouisia muris]|uniref:LacI family transcriptional regulator n=1 Tax=Petralouisia muris TaxID=3032872 RepID=A0AC61RRZ6_9FIRM|nr:LacI family DNA-binding transcriptional regulator [Petralouisia muris]TGY92647.1 LacI family transcriptional regulator [Petralouisia muris]